jgi:hypothetical protein
MKRIFILFAIFFISFYSEACDVCGCGTGYFNPFIFPHLTRNYIGMGYQYRYYKTQFLEEGHMHNNKEYYNSFLLTAQYSPAKNWQLTAILPWQLNKQDGNHGKFSESSIGDIVLLANYKLLDHTNSKDTRQTIQVGGGVKLATGHHELDENDPGIVDNYHFQAGTGSTDILFNASYQLSHKAFVFQTGFTYKMNTKNKEDYRFGNRLLNVTQAKYNIMVGSFSIAPGIGFMAEHLQQDKLEGVKVDRERTGGYNLQAMVGLDMSYQKFALGFNYSAPVKQNLGDGQIKAMPGLNAHLSYSF